MTTMINKLTTFVCKVVRTNTTLTITSPGGKSCVLNLTRLDKIEMTPDEQQVIYPMEDAGEAGVPFSWELSIAEMEHIVSVRTKIAATFTADAPPPVPEVKPALVEAKPIAPAVQEVKPQQMAGVTGLKDYVVTAPEPAAPQNVETPTKKRKEKLGQFIHDEYRKRTRGHGIDEMEQRITHLQATVHKASQDVSFLTYDIPTTVRAQIVDPCHLLWCFGFRHTESLWIIPTRNLTNPVMQELFAMWDRFPEIKYGFEEISFKSVERVRALAQAALDKVLRDAHTALITGIAAADKELAEAMRGELTSKEQEQATAKRDNSVRAELRHAADLLNRSVVSAVEYDSTEQLSDLLKGLRDVIASRAEVFNVQQRMRRGKPVVV